MQLKQFVLVFILSLILGSLPLFADVEKFKSFGCIKCHDLKLHNLKAEDSDSKAPDLSDVGKRHNEEFIGNYMQKKEKINDKQHPKLFKGDKEEREAIAKWLASLK